MLMKRVLEYMGLEPERLQARWVSGSEGPRFAEVITQLTKEIKALGPNRKLRDDA